MRKAVKNGLLIFGMIALIGFVLKRNISHERFDSTKWKTWTESEAELSLRWDMMNSLRNNYELKGKTKTEIIELLGNSESKSDSEFGYYLGMAKRGIEIGNLTIKFDKNGKVSEFNVRRS